MKSASLTTVYTLPCNPVGIKKHLTFCCYSHLSSTQSLSSLPEAIDISKGMAVILTLSTSPLVCPKAWHAILQNDMWLHISQKHKLLGGPVFSDGLFGALLQRARAQ